MSNAITLRDVSRAGSEAHWPLIAAEVQGYLATWVAAANAQVSGQQLEIRTAPIHNPTDQQSCGWLIAAHLAATTPAGRPVVTLLDSHIKGTSIEQRVGFLGPPELLVGVQEDYPYNQNYQVGWTYPAWGVGDSRGTWSRPPEQHYPFNGLVTWSLAPGAEFFLFLYSQHTLSERRAMPLFIAREQSGGHWFLAASIQDSWRSLSWSRRANLPTPGVRLLTFTASRYTWALSIPAGMIQLRRPAEVILMDVNWEIALYNEPQKTIPPFHFDPVLLPPAFATCTASQSLAALQDSRGQWWLNLGNSLAMELPP